MASTYGRILSLSAPYLCGGRVCYRKPQLLKPRVMKKGIHYASVVLSNGKGFKKQLLVHRLIAYTFIPNPSNLPFINHKDENPSNNAKSNLEWCTQQYNCNYGTHNARMAKTLRETAYQRRKVVQLSLNGDFIAMYDSITQASQTLNISRGSISRICRRITNSFRGYKWLYLEDYESLVKSASQRTIT